MDFTELTMYAQLAPIIMFIILYILIVNQFVLTDKFIQDHSWHVHAKMEIIEFKENVHNVKTGKSMMQLFKHVKVNAR